MTYNIEEVLETGETEAREPGQEMKDMAYDMHKEMGMGHGEANEEESEEEEEEEYMADKGLAAPSSDPVTGLQASQAVEQKQINQEVKAVSQSSTPDTVNWQKAALGMSKGKVNDSAAQGRFKF